MRLQLPHAVVELSIINNDATVFINGIKVSIDRETALNLIIGGVFPRKRGAQTLASRQKLSRSLRRYHAEKKNAT